MGEFTFRKVETERLMSNLPTQTAELVVFPSGSLHPFTEVIINPQEWVLPIAQSARGIQASAREILSATF